MSKLFASIEDYDDASDSNLESLLIDQNEALTDLNTIQDQEEQASNIIETLEQAETANTAEESYAIAKEQLLAIVSYTKTFSLESFKDDSDKALSISQEGFFSRILNVFDRLFTTKRSFSLRLEAALEKLKTNGKRESIIEDPSWSKNLIAKSSTTIKPQDIVKYLNELNGIIDQNEVNERLAKVASIYDTITTELKKGNATSREEIDSAVYDINRNAIADISDLSTLAAKYQINKNIDLYPNYEPIDYKTAKSIADLVLDNFIMDESSFYGFKRYKQAINSLDKTLFRKKLSTIRFKKPLGEKIGGAETSRSIISSLNKSVSSIVNVYNQKAKTAHSVLRYIEASSK